LLLDATFKSHNSNLINLKIDPSQTMSFINKKNLLLAKKQQQSNFMASQDNRNLNKLKTHQKRNL